MEQEYNEQFSKKIIKYGRLFSLFGILGALILPIYLYLRYGAAPSPGQLLAGYITVLSMFGVAYVSDMIAFYPTTGAVGIYMGYMAGNMSAVRLPCMLAAQEASGLKHGTREGEIVGTIAMSTSVFVSLACTTLTALIGARILEILPSFVLQSFDYVTPAIMGAMGCVVAQQDKKAFAIALVISVIVLFIKPPSFLLFPLVILGSILACVYLYKKKTLPKEEN